MATKKAKRGRTAKPGTVTDLRRRLWQAVEAATDIVTDPEADAALRLRAVHGLTQASGSYLKLVEADEFEARLAALEARQKSQF